MNKNIAQIIWCTLVLGFAGMVYFLSLTMALPFIITVVVVVLFAPVSYIYLMRSDDYKEPMANKPTTITAYFILIAGLSVLLYNGYHCVLQYGDWDAWWLWNYHARFWADARYWEESLKLNIAFYHPDYPLFTSSGIAFFWRLWGKTSRYIPFLFTLYFTIATPVVLYLSLCKRNLYLAGALFIAVCGNSFYLNHGLAQYADLPLGFLFLCAIICLDNIRHSSLYTIAVGALLGCCMWTKNEGIMLSVVFVAFHIKALLANGRWRLFLAGIALPVITLLVFKSLTPKTDLIDGQGIRTLQYLTQAARYKLVMKWMYQNFTQNFALAGAGLMLYPLYAYYRKQWPDRKLLMLLACIACYGIVYVMTTMDLAWHLETSLDRVLFQLMPALWYVLGSVYTQRKDATPNTIPIVEQ